LDESIHDAALQRCHVGQWKSPKRSTVPFAAFIEARARASRRIVDLGCGAGAALSQLAAAHPHVEFVGIDVSPKLIGFANALSEGGQSPNVTFVIDDWFELQCYPAVDGVISLQTLSWLSGFEAPLQ